MLRLQQELVLQKRPAQRRARQRAPPPALHGGSKVGKEGRGLVGKEGLLRCCGVRCGSRCHGRCRLQAGLSLRLHEMLVVALLL